MHFKYSKRIIALAILFLFAFFVRFFYVSRGMFNYEAIDLIASAQKTAASAILHYARGTASPLTVIVAGFFINVFKFFGAAEAAEGANFMSVFFGTASVILFFLFVERLLGFKKAFISALLLSCFGPHIEISTFANSVVLSMCMYLAGLLFMLAFTDNGRKSFVFFSAIFLGLSMAARFADFLMILPTMYLFSFSKESLPERLRLFFSFLFIAFLTASLYYFTLFYENGLAAIPHVVSNIKILGFQGSGWIKLADIFMPEGLILVSVGLNYMLLKKYIKPFIFLILWFLVLQFSYNAIGASRFLVAACVPLIIAQGSFIGGFKGKMFYVSCFLACVISLGGFLRFSDALELKRKYFLETDFTLAGAMRGESIR